MSSRLACLLATCLVLASATTGCLAGPLPASDGAIDIPTPPPSPFDIDTIWVPLLLSYAAYCPEWSLAAMECNYCQNATLSGFEPVGFLVHNKTDTFAWLTVSHESEEIYVSFRGTHSLLNWITDLDAAKETIYGPDKEQKARVHVGFYHAYLNVADQLHDQLTTLLSQSTYDGYAVRVTGHSLGAALAALCVDDLGRWVPANFPGHSVGSLMFGLPRVGNLDFHYFFQNNTGIEFATHVTNKRDIVPHLPPRVLNFHHIATEVWCCSGLSECAGVANGYMVCDGSGEDPHCADSIDFHDVTDHLHYGDIPLDCIPRQ